MNRRLCLLLYLLIPMLVISCNQNSQPQKSQEQIDKEYAQKVMEEGNRALRQQTQARLEYARSLRRYYRDLASGSMFELETRSAKDQYFSGLEDVLILRCDGPACMNRPSARDAFLSLANASKLKELKFKLYVIGYINGQYYRAYDLEKGQWEPTLVAFCSPADSCTIRPKSR